MLCILFNLGNRYNLLWKTLRIYRLINKKSNIIIYFKMFASTNVPHSDTVYGFFIDPVEI